MRGDASRLDSDKTSPGTIRIALLYPVRAALDRRRPRHIIRGVAWQERKTALPRVLDAHEVLIR